MAQQVAQTRTAGAGYGYWQDPGEHIAMQTAVQQQLD